MGDKTRELLKAKRRHGWYLAVMLVLAVLVTVGVGGLFHQPAVAKTYQVTVLTCTAEAPVGPGYAGYFVHTHNEDCFDENETLVCPLPEIKAHVHDETCYTTTAVQTCGLAESDGHQHTEACYTRVRGDLICTLSTEPVLDEAGNVLEEGHVHTDECFAWTEELTCGMEAGEGAHHHNESCFEYVTNLSCDKPEVILHAHSDDCYQKNEDGSIYVDEDGNTWLICGMTEVTEHVHGPECFTTYELDDEAAGNTENTEGEESGLVFLFPEKDASEEEEQPAESTNPETETGDTDVTDDGNADPADGNTPDTDETVDTEETENTKLADGVEPNAEGKKQEAASGEAAPTAEEPHTVVYTGTRGAEKGGMTVLAEIPEGALDEAAQLVLSDADESAARKQILQLVNENAAEGEEREISSMLLLDIGFVSGGEPAAVNGLDPIRITIRAAAIRSMSAPKLFHLSDGTAREVKDVLFDAEAGTAVFTGITFSPFAVVDLTGEDPAEEAAEETVGVSMPAQSFTGETDGVIVSVEAPEGAFPEGTTMVVSPVEMDDDTLSNVTGAVESSGEQKLVTAQAVDISFFDADGNLIEPKLPIKVSMKSALVSESENVALVHLTEANTADTAENETSEAPAAPTAEVVTDVQVVENPDEHNEIQFESDAFSVYVLVGTETITTNFITADGETYTITVTYGPEAGIPAGATLAVAEIPRDSEEYAAYLAQAQSAVKAGSSVGGTETSAEVTEEASATPNEAETPEEMESAAETESTVSTGGTTDRVTVTTARFFDITILDAEGNPVEPAAPVDVKIEYMEPAETAENYQVVHFGEETEVLNPAVSGADGTASAFDFQANSFSVFGIVGTKIIEADILLSDGKLYTVSVIYDEDAHIPSGSSLMVVPFEEGTTEYEYARNSVLADKKARGEWVDLSNFGLAALDISILNPNGEEIEPEASVQVEIRIKELPGVENLNEVAGTLAIQHHVEVEDGVVVETVFGGNADANFKLETNGTVAAKGITVDPNSVSTEDFMPIDSTAEGFSESWSESNTDENYVVSFEAPVFSTFTVTWNSSQTTSNQLRASQLSNGKYILYARDAANNNYYALVPGTELNSVQITVNGDLVQYSGSENLYWDVEVSENAYSVPLYSKVYHFSFIENGTKYYLAAGATGDHVKVGTSKTNYGNADTTSWGQWSDYIHSAGDTFLQSNNGTFRTWNVLGQNDWGNRSIIYFEKEGASSGDSHATIHYVDEEGHDLTVSNGSISSSTLLNNYAYLIYDIEGGEYEYKEAYIRRNSTDTAIRAHLHWNGSNWQYTTNGNSWSNVNENDDIYVVYKKKITPTEGGTPTLVELDEDEKPERPTVTKDSTVNGDGTNTLSLSVTSHTRPREVLKLADVIVIFDRSGSMGQEIGNDNETSDTSKQRMALLKNAVNSLARDLIGDNSVYIYTDKEGVKHKQIEMSLVSFSTEATNATAFTDDLSTFEGWVNELSPDGGTNWEQALQKANEASVDPGRATFVIFVTDGEPTFRMTRMTDADSSLNGDMYSNGPTYYNSNNVYGTGSSDNLKDNTQDGRNYRAALAQAQAIVGKNKNLYMIGVGPEVANLEQFNTDAGADGYYPATSAESLTSAFEDIKKRIAAMAGYSDFQISDGITDLTQTVQKSTLVNFVEDDFTYSKERLATEEEIGDTTKVPTGAEIVTRENVRYVVWDNWDPASESCATAKYENGAVIWNMGSSFMPQEGYTYQVRFKVWPSQAAYDLLADLNNGVKNYASLSDAEKAQIKEPTAPGGMYTLKTNSETSYNYKDATIIDGTVTTSGDDLLSPPGKFDEVDPLELTTKPLKVQKQWHENYSASVDAVTSITMELYDISAGGQETQIFKTITLDETPNADGKKWYSENNYISYGLLTYNTETNAGAKIYETGHDFTLREVGINAHYFELTAGIYRPMFINGNPTILEKMDAAPSGMGSDVFHYIDGTHHYYRLDGKIYRDTQSDVLLIATNTRRSYMDLNKVVVDESGVAAVDDTEFEYKITFTVPRGIANYDSLEKYIWFSVYDTVAGRTLSPSEYTYTGVITPAQENPDLFSDPEYANYLVAISEQQMTLKIKQGWNVRFLNLPIGTTYSFEETNIPEGYSFVKAEVSGTQWIANMVNGTDQGNEVTMTCLPSITSSDNTTIITGSIDNANARYKTTYTNRTIPVAVKILKTSQDGTTPLPGAVFSLYTESGYTADPKRAAKTNLTSGEDGIIDLGKLSFGKYYLVETSAPAGYILLSDPVTITVASNGVTYNQSGSSLSMGNSGVIHQDGTDLYTLTVTNNAGVSLPQTGGEGTLLFSVLGTILILSSTLLILAKRKQEAYTPRH